MGGCFAGLLVEGPWCNPWISGEPNHLENNFPGSSERNRKRTTPSEILNDAIDEKNPPLVCRIPSAVSIVWWLLCSSAKVYLYISHLPWICSRKFGNSSKNTSYQMMIKHGDQIHKRIPKNSTLRKKTRHQGTEQGGNIASNTTPKKLLDHWSKMRRVPPELSDTTIHFFHSFLLTFWKPFHDVPCVKGFQNGMLFITSPPERVEMFNIPPIPHELPCFSSFLPTNPNWLVTHQLHRRFVSHQTIGAHARQCATALGAGSWGWSFFFVFFLRSNHQSWQMILHSFNIFHPCLFCHFVFFWGDSAWKLSWLNMWDPSQITTWRIGTTCRKTQMLGEFQRILLNRAGFQFPMRNFDWVLPITLEKQWIVKGQGWLPFIKNE